MPSARLLAGLAVALLVAATAVPALVPPAAGSSPPQAVCGLCDDRFERRAADAGYPLAIASGEVVVAVGANGTGHWTIRLETTDGAEAVAADPAGFAALVRQRYDHSRSLVDDPRDLRVAVDGSTVVVRFRVPGMAHRSAGDVLLIDYFHRGPDAGYRMDATRLVVRGPPGTTLANDPPGAVAENGTAVWTGGDAGPEGSTYVVFGHGGGVATWLAGQAAVAADVGPLVLSQTAAVSLLPVLVLLGAVVTLAGLLRSFRDRLSRPAAVGAVVAGLGGLVAVAGLAGVTTLGRGNGTFLVATGAGYVLVGLAGAGLARARGGADLRSLSLLIVAGVAPVAVASLGAGPDLAPVPFAAVQSALFPVVGYFAVRPDRSVLPVAVALALVTVLGVAAGAPYGGFGPPFVAILVTLLTVGVVVAGVPLAVLGAALGAGEATSDVPVR